MADELGSLLLARLHRPIPLGPYRHALVGLDLADAPGWTLHIHDRRLSLSVGRTDEAETTVVADSATMTKIAEGRRPPLEAFLAGDLRVRGNLELALRLSSLFLDDDAPVHTPKPSDVRAAGLRVFTLEAGDGPPVVLLHGLGATNASMLPTMVDLASDHRVVAPDLPGFGGSDKPLRRLHAAFYAEWLVEFLDAVGIERAHLVGNSMGGRVAIEVGLRFPARVGHIALFAPSPAFLRKRRFLWLVKLARPELALLPMPQVPRHRVKRAIRSMFHRSDRIPSGWLDAAADEFIRLYTDPRARRAFFSAARQIYLEDPFEGRGRFWARLEDLDRPALFIWGRDDRLVPVGFAPHVERTLPAATSVVLEDCGHVPQYECPEETHKHLRDFLADRHAAGERAEADAPVAE